MVTTAFGFPSAPQRRARRRADDGWGREGWLEGEQEAMVAAAVVDMVLAVAAAEAFGVATAVVDMVLAVAARYGLIYDRILKQPFMNVANISEHGIHRSKK